MSKLTLLDRLACAFFGVIGGGVLGLVLSWMLGVYSRTFFMAEVPVVIEDWVVRSAFLFGLIGLIFGPPVGTLLGTAIAAIFDSESGSSHEMPFWLVALLLVVIAGGAWWWISA